MGRPAKPTPRKVCPACKRLMTRRIYRGWVEDLAAFMRRVYCDRACMAVGMQKDRCASPSHSRAKAHRHVRPRCERCGKTGRLHVHHVDEDPFNNTPSNLRTLCASCHRHMHSPNFIAATAMRKPCTYCARPSAKAGLCHSHLSRRQRFGNPLAVKIRTGSGWILDTSGLPVRSRRSPKVSQTESRACAATETPSFRTSRQPL